MKNKQLKTYLLCGQLCILFLCSFATKTAFSQGSLQRSVRLSNDNGNIVTIMTAAPTASFSLFLPNSINASLTKGSLLYALGSGQLNWTSTASADSGYVLALMPSGADLIPTWRSPNSSGFARNDEPFITFSADNGSLSNNRVFSVSTGLSITNTGVDNGSIVIANTGVLKLLSGNGITLSDSTGNITISSSVSGWGLTGNSGTTAWNGATGNFLGTTDNTDLILGTGTAAGTREKLRISGTTGNILLSQPSGQLQLQGTGSGVTTLQAGAQGLTNINYTLPITAPTANGQILSTTTAGAMSWVNAGAGSVTSVGLAMPSIFTVSNSPVVTIGTLTAALNTQTANTVFAGPASGADAIPTFRSLVAADIPALNYVTSVGLAMPSIFTVSNSPVTTIGTLTAALNTQSANLIFAGPASGVAAIPTFRSLAAADIPALNYVTSVGLAMPSIFTVSNSPVTTSGTLTAALNTQLANMVFAGPASGAAAIPTFRSLVAADIPALNYVTSVAMTVPGVIFTSPVSGSPITSSGTLALALNTQTANTVFAGPASGAPATPTFRAFVPLDVNSAAWTLNGNTGTTAWNGATGNFAGTSDNTDFVLGTGATVGTREKLRISGSTNNVLLSRGGAQFQLQGTGSGISSFQAGGQGATNINYTLPTAAPTANGQVLSSTTAGTMSWANGVTGSGTATRIAFWGPGPGVTTNLQDDAGLYWDNTNKYLSVGTGTAPAATLDVSRTGALTVNNKTALLTNTTTGTSGATKTGLDIQSSGSWTGSGATNIGLNVNISGGVNNYAGLFNGGYVGIGTSNPATQLHLRYTDAATNTRANVLTIDHNTTNTPAVGYGANLLYQLQTTAALASTGSLRDAGSIGSYWVNATDASRRSAMTFSTVDTPGVALAEKVRINPNGYMGVGTTAPNTRLDINGAYATRQVTITLQNGQNDNINIGDASFVRIVGPTAPFSISGICCGTDGKRCRIANMTGQDWTIMDSSSYSTLGNRIETNTKSNIIVRGPIPVLDMIYDSVTNQWILGTLNANQTIGAVGSIIYAYKTADESVANSAVLQDDDHLSINMNAGETWEINGELQIDNAANNIDVKMAFQMPAATAVMRIFYTGIQDAGGNAVMGNGLFTSSNTPKTVQINAGVSTLLSFRGIITLGGTSGVVKLRWAQGIANNSTTIIRAYSYMKILRIN